MFSLKWNDYHQCLGKRVSELFESDDLTDVSLACEDGIVIKSHKFVLSLFSSFFRKIFSENPCKHPIVILKGLRSPEVQRVLSFIYLGQARMKEWEITEFLQAAESLRIDGINSNNPIISSTDSSTRVLTCTSTFRTGGGGPVHKTGDTGSRKLSGNHDGDSGSASEPSVGSPHSWPPTSRRSYDYHYHQSDVQAARDGFSPYSPSQRAESHLSTVGPVIRQTVTLEGLRRPGSPIPFKRSKSSELIISEATITKEKEVEERTLSPVRFRSESTVAVDVPLIIQSEDHDHPSSGGSCISIAQFYQSDADEPEDGDEVQDLRTYPRAGFPASLILPPRKRSWEVDRSLHSYQSRSSSWPDSSTNSGPGSRSAPLKSTNYLPLSLLAAPSGSVSASAAAVVVSQSSYSALRTLPLFSPTNSRSHISGPPTTGATGYPLHLHRVHTQHLNSPSSSPFLSIEETQRRHARALAAAAGSYQHHRQGQQGPPQMTAPSVGHQSSRIMSSQASPPSSSSRPRTKAIRSSQVPQSSRYTAAEVDLMVEQVDNFPGPLVPCAICSKFVKRERLRAHIHECHLLQGQKITCPHCFIGLKSKGSYRVHIWRHKRGNLGIKEGPPGHTGGSGNSQTNPNPNIQPEVHQYPFQPPRPTQESSALLMHLQHTNKYK